MEQMTDKIKHKIEEAFSPILLEIRNDSAKHRGHAGDDGSGESHFHLTIVSDLFKNKSRIDRQRMVHTILKTELNSEIHALALVLHTPEEQNR